LFEDPGERHEHRITEQVVDFGDCLNYVATIGDESFFAANNYFTNVSIMALKILDYLMVIHPHSSMKQTLLNNRSVAVISQLLLVSNPQLTATVLDFISVHCCSHYEMF